MSEQYSFNTFNPLKNKLNQDIYSSESIKELDKKLAHVPQAAKVLSNTPTLKISRLLKEIKSELIKNKHEIARYYYAESGLDETRFQKEFSRTLFQLEHFSDYIVSSDWQNRSDYKDSINEKIFVKQKIPIGPVLVMGASNFPLAYSTIGGDSVAALAAGCPVIVKAHPYHVGTSLEVMKAIEKAIETLTFPKGTFTHVIDEGFEIAGYLAKHSVVKGIGFTGSISGGESIIKLVHARNHPIPVFTEMGSLNPIFILNSYDFKKSADLAKQLAHSVCNDRGQFCTKPGIIFIPKTNNGTKLSEQLKDEITAFKSGPMLHPNIKENFERAVSKIKEIKSPAQFHESEITKEFHVQNSLLIIDESHLDSYSLLKTEIFGPFTTVVLYDNVTQLLKQLMTLNGQLSCSIYSQQNKELSSDQALLNLAIEKAGRVVLNNVPTGVEVSKAMHHGGPYPASSDSRFTAVGSDSIHRFVRYVTIQKNII